MAKKYGIYQVETFQERDGIQWYFEVAFRAEGVLHILANSSRRPDYAGYSTKEGAEQGGLQWLHDHLEKQLKEVKEALNG